MLALLTIIHVLLCILLVVSILLQSSKGGGLAGMFGGGGGMGQVLGGRGAATFLSKITLWLGVGFAVTSITIALLSGGTSSRPRSLLEQVEQQQPEATPSTILPKVPGAEEDQGGVEPPAPQQGQQ